MAMRQDPPPTDWRLYRKRAPALPGPNLISAGSALIEPVHAQRDAADLGQSARLRLCQQDTGADQFGTAAEHAKTAKQSIAYGPPRLKRFAFKHRSKLYLEQLIDALDNRHPLSP
ncbi:hypothetical protein LQ948_07615 [Jiella sp. MQZ9-1]|uniref:Uncharacterized protein n=1 Tax=Jiella flava TaxID=2816857 RepID=A0A939FW75_9HYPH|nr:hypothetical protein [Jiella flava]MBO0662652.1 hypothetical protein [Jiella flava]MCD2471074.1 hypothetical protein [Jiella flava]